MPNSFLSSIHKAPVMNQTLKFKFNLSHLTREIETSFISLFEQFKNIFAESMLNLGRTSLVSHEIELTDPTPVWTPPYPIPLIKDQFLSYLKRSQILFQDPKFFW